MKVHLASNCAAAIGNFWKKKSFFLCLKKLCQGVLALRRVAEKGLSCVYILCCIVVEWADSKQSCVYISCCSSVDWVDSMSSVDNLEGVTLFI